MPRIAFACLTLVTSAALATAGPISWSYQITFSAPKGNDGILVGSEYKPPEFDGGPEPAYYFVVDTNKPGYTVTGSELPTGTSGLFSFGQGSEDQVQTLPAGKRYSTRQFDLSWEFAANGETVQGSSGGSISASGIFTTGSGNYWLGMDHEETITLGGQTAKVRFSDNNRGESMSWLEMTVTPVETTGAPNVPEPGTLILSGIAVAGGVGVWWRR